MKINHLGFLIAMSFTLLAGCTASPSSPQTYDQTSWHDIIPASCRHFSDGCNTCTRAAGKSTAACTRKACQHYNRPQCLDAAMAKSRADTAQETDYQCADDYRFSVYWGEYRAGDQRIKLKENQLMFSDGQAHKSSLLTRVRSASGVKYENGEVGYWSKGDGAIVLEGDDIAHRDCHSLTPLQ